MKAVILVGGESTRLRPLTYDIPKAMVPIVNRPFLERMIEWLRAHDVSEIVLTTCYLPEKIERHFGDGSRFGVEIAYVTECEPLGTGGAIKNCERLLDSAFLVLNGDILTDLDLTAAVRAHRARQARATILSVPVEDPSRFGVIVSDAEGWVQRFVEKPPADEAPSRDINAGIYLLEPEVLPEMPHGRFSIERDFFPRLIEAKGRMHHHRASGYWIDIGTVEHYLQAHWDILAGRLRAAVPGRQQRPGLWLADGAGVDPGARLTPPVVVGAGARVEAGARIGPRVVLGDQTRVGRGAAAADCVVWPRSRLDDRANVSGTIIGFEAVVPAGTCLSDGALRSGESAANPV